MNTATCPPAERWKAHLDGTLPPPEQPALTAHLDECAACQKTLEQLAAGGDSLLDVARQVGSENGPASATPHALPDNATQADAAQVAWDHGALDFLAPPTKPEHLGRLGHYDVHEVIGKGGFGVVLKAFDERLHRVVAIKVLAPAYANNGAARLRFLREAQSGAAIKNEHVVAIYDVERDAQPPYLAMEMIDGASLQEKIDKHGPLGLKEILRIGIQMAEGLAAAHKQGLVHRDIKPANILLENGVERVKITDFGLARAVDDASVTQSGTVAGTPMYMSPEQAEGLPIDHRSDLFSLGTVLYAMCTGHPPFRASGTHAVLKRVIDAAPRPIREINNEIPDWLCDIVGKLHAKKPEERFQTANEVAELLGQRLADVQAGRAIQGEPSRVSDRSEEIGHEVVRDSGEPAQPVWRRRERKSAAVVLVSIVALASLVAIAMRFRQWTNDGSNEAKQKSGVLSLRLKDTAIQYRIDGHGANQTGVAVLQMPLEAGQHKVWFMLGDRQFETLPFTINPAKRTELSLEVTSERGLAILNGKPLDVISIGNHNGWVQLLNGNDLTGWRADQPEKWRVKDGVIIGEARSYLVTKQLFQDFDCRIEAKINAGGVGSVSVRSLPGVHADIRIGTKDAQAPTGSLFLFSEPRTEALVQAPKELATADSWITLEVVVRGKRVEVKVNGTTTAEQTVGQLPNHGGINLNVYGPGSILHVRKIEIKELPPEEPGWVQLFNGADLTGWTNPKKAFGAWKVKQGVLVGKGDQAFLRTERGPFGDFHLRMEAKYVGGTAGLVLREQSPDVAGAGYECLMDNHKDGDFNTGAVAHLLTKNAMGPFVVPKKVMTQEDQWFTLEIIAGGNRVQSFVDGKKAVDFVDINNDYKDGFIALNVRGAEGELHVKKVEIKELPPAERGWIQIFNGMDLDGWTSPQRDKWKVENGALVGAADGRLTTNQDYGNLHCRLKAKFNAEGIGSVIFGGKADSQAGVRIGNQQAQTKTGSLLLFAKPKTEAIVAYDKQLITPDTWFDLEIIQRGKNVIVKVNGTTTAEKEIDKLPAGFYPIGLHADAPGTVITVGKIEIKELPASTPPMAVAPSNEKKAQ
jgi:serine/threonine protein kinase